MYARVLFPIWIVCCVLLALGYIGIWVVVAEGGDLALMLLVFAIFCTVGYIVLRVITWAMVSEVDASRRHRPPD